MYSLPTYWFFVHKIYVSYRPRMCIVFGVPQHFVFCVAAPVVCRHVDENDPICRSVTLCLGMRSVYS